MYACKNKGWKDPQNLYGSGVSPDMKTRLNFPTRDPVPMCLRMVPNKNNGLCEKRTVEKTHYGG